MKSDKSEIIIYQTGDGLAKISVHREAMCKNCTFQIVSIIRDMEWL
jgi:hypothetical protein